MASWQRVRMHDKTEMLLNIDDPTVVYVGDTSHFVALIRSGRSTLFFELYGDDIIAEEVNPVKVVLHLLKANNPIPDCLLEQFRGMQLNPGKIVIQLLELPKREEDVDGKEDQPAGS